MNRGNSNVYRRARRLDLTRIRLAKRPNAAALAGAPSCSTTTRKWTWATTASLRAHQGWLTSARHLAFCDQRASIRGKTSPTSVSWRASSASFAHAPGDRVADMGVSPAMVALRVEMERIGLPTVCLTARPAHDSRPHMRTIAQVPCASFFQHHPASDQETLSTRS